MAASKFHSTASRGIPIDDQAVFHRVLSNPHAQCHGLGSVGRRRGANQLGHDQRFGLFRPNAETRMPRRRLGRSDKSVISR